MKNKILSLLSGDSMKSRALRGTALSVMGFGGSQMIRLASNLILTRILFPEAFGLMALVQVLLAGLQMFSDLGILHSIIQSKRGDEPAFLNTAWTLQIVRGILLWLMACSLAVPVANFYGQAALIPIIPVLGLTTVLSGFDSTRIASATRHVILGRVTVLEIGSQFIGIILMILLAVWLKSVWALVFGSLLTALAKTILSHIILPGQSNRLEWDKSAFWEMFHFGKYIFLGTISGFFILHGDRLVLGKFVSLEALAIYTIALTLAGIPQMLSAHLVDRVLLPLYRNRPPADSEQNRKQIGRLRLLFRSVFLVVAAIMAFGGEYLIDILYDPRYQMAGVFLVLIGLSMMPRIIIGGYDAILLANGNSRDFTILTTGTAIFRVIVLLILVQKLGVLGAVITPAIVDILVYPFLIYTIRRYRGWYPLQDLCFAIFAITITAATLWYRPTVMNMLSELNLF